MRWLALALLFANLALAVWLMGHESTGPQAKTGPPPEIGHLRLLRETAAAAEDTTCFTLGPFDDASRTRQAGRRLDAFDVQSQQRTTQDDEVYGYQVLLPPFESRERALEATRSLASKGIEDYFVIVTNPELENAVSVGLFQKKRYALRHLEYLQDHGFGAELRVRTRERTRYWLDYRDPQGRITPELIESMSADSTLQRLDRPCG